MQRHVIIGKGNLGCDIYDAAIRGGHKAMILTRSNGFNWPESLEQILQWNPSHIWVTAGFGSVEQVKKDLPGAIKTHVILPVELCRNVPVQISIGIFSSDYAAVENIPHDITKRNTAPRSLYAATKVWMEEALEIIDRPNTTVFRVSTLYGNHYPEKCLPAKLKNRFPTPCTVSLPQNWVAPTPTWWVADTLFNNLTEVFQNRHRQFNCAPNGGTTVCNWGKTILGEGYKIENKGFDKERPINSAIGCNIINGVPRWDELWLEHLKRGLAYPKVDQSVGL